MDSWRSVLRFSLLIISLLLFLSCEESLDLNPLDSENNPDFVAPETTITVTDLDGGTLDTSTVTINFEGNDLVVEYAYSFNGGNYSGWTADTSVTYDYLDEGDYTFSVKGRYITGDEDPTPATANFLVDMVGENGIRVYPLLTEMTTPTNVNIYAEMVENLVLFSFQIQYDPAILSIDVEAITRGNLISGITEHAFLPKEISTGLIEVSFMSLESSGVSGTGSLANITLSGNGASTSALVIINPRYGYIDGSVETVTERANGMVVVQ